jgi:hypothetical protein
VTAVARKSLTALIIGLWALTGCGGDSSTEPGSVKPVITVEGVQADAVYTAPVTITISVDRGSYQATLDGQDFVSGHSVGTPGNHVLVINARSGSATSTREVRFTIGTSATGTFDVASWNIEWFGSPFDGPFDDHLQLTTAAAFIAASDMDVWGLGEMVSNAHFDSLKARLPGYDGFLGNDALVSNGAQFYSASEQKLGFLYKTSVATVVGQPRVILTANDASFAGRPPLEVRLRVTLNGITEEVVVIMLHMKARQTDTGPADYQKRLDAATALKAYLDTTYPTQKVWVIGDWNDDLDVSIEPGKPTPYAAFLQDNARYAFVSKALTDTQTPTYKVSPDPIDHHLVTNEVLATYIAGSVQSAKRTSPATGQLVCDDAITSDHCAVFSRYRFPQ